MRFTISGTIEILRKIRILRNCVELSEVFRSLEFNPSECYPQFPPQSPRVEEIRSQRYQESQQNECWANFLSILGSALSPSPWLTLCVCPLSRLRSPLEKKACIPTPQTLKRFSGAFKGQGMVLSKFAAFPAVLFNASFNGVNFDRWSFFRVHAHRWLIGQSCRDCRGWGYSCL